MFDTRLIERWLPIVALGEESVRERRSMTALPPTYYLHVWWARRPLVASRAAVLASLLPASADRGKFLHVLGIHGDPVAAKKRIAIADRKGERLGANALYFLHIHARTPIGPMARVQLIIPDEDRDRFVHQARRGELSLSAWLRAAAHERLERRQRSVPFLSLAEMAKFFRECDAMDGPPREPDWEEHLGVIDASHRRSTATN